MKLFSAFAVAAAAVAPPRIELQLDESLRLKSTKAFTNSGKVQPSGVAVMSRQDYTVVCAAGDSAATCPMPKAKAYDSVDQEVTVARQIYLVDTDGVKALTKVNSIDRTKRSTYLIKFDASDTAGNHAEQVVIALELNDESAPIVRHNGCTSKTVEAKSAYQMCAAVTAKDNIDGDVTSRVRYNIMRGASEQIAKYATLSEASAAMTSDKVGTYTIEAVSTDKAGVYGTKGSNNKAKYSWTVTVRDTTAPVITVTGANPHKTECATTYTDFGATAQDNYDGKIAVKTNNGVVTSKLGQYSVHYDAADAASNSATQKSRTVVVQDTTSPVVTLNGAGTIELNAGGKAPVDAGAVCKDSCDGDIITSAPVFDKEINLQVPGTYTAKFTCEDKSLNSASVSRKYIVVDRTAPIITLTGKDSLTLEASPTGTYTDQGASCHDYVSGNLNGVVKTRTTDEVNMAVPGTYKYYYDCKDEAGNKATPLMRTIVVKDTTCPKITVTGASVVSVEAGFPYVDGGATAFDSLDGDITAKVRVANTVDTAKAFYAKRNCAEIKSADSLAKSGMYFITSSNFQRISVFCDMATGETWNKCENCVATKPSSGADATCATRGMKVAKTVSAAAKSTFGAAYATVNESTNTYLCTVGASAFDVSSKVDHAKIAHAETGKYIVRYAVADKAGNVQCAVGKRTVIVSDTLPPVIALKLNGKLIHTSGTKNLGNPAFDAKVNPFLAEGLMEEQTSSVNGWVIGAVASAVTGVALLGFASKSSTVVSVPV